MASYIIRVQKHMLAARVSVRCCGAGAGAGGEREDRGALRSR